MSSQWKLKRRVIKAFDVSIKRALEQASDEETTNFSKEIKARLDESAGKSTAPKFAL